MHGSGRTPFRILPPTPDRGLTEQDRPPLADIFISYARSTEAIATRVVEALVGLGYTVWRDDALPAHRAYADEIQAQLDAARAVVVIWSADAARSEWVRSEADRARSQRKLVQVTVDGAALPMPFDQIQSADLSAWRGEPDAAGWRTVLASIDALMHRAPAPGSAEIVPAAEALPRPGHPGSGHPVHGAGRRRLGLIVVALLVLAVAVVAVTRSGLWNDAARPDPDEGPAARTPAPEATIAVLPFENLSPDPDQVYFSEGLSEELMTLLAQSSGLRVAARTSAFALDRQELDPAAIAERLNVAHLLLGTVRRADERLRITARLVDARDGFIRWSETYDRRLDDVFDVQENIAGEVVHALRSTLLTATPKTLHTDPAAYALYLRARYLARQFTAESMAEAVELFRRVIDIDPGYLPAYTKMAIVQMNRASIDLEPKEAAFEQAREAAQTALALDAEFGPGYDVLGWIALFYDGDLPAAARNYQRALALDPTNLGILSNAAVLAVALGRLDEAIELLDYTLLRDPVDPIGHSNRANACYLAGRYDDARASLETVLSLSPGYQGAHYRLSLLNLLAGDPEAALAAAGQEPLEAPRLLAEALALHDLGRAEEAEAALDEVKRGWGDRAAGNLAQVYAWRGEVDEAFSWLEREIEANGTGALMEYQHDPLLAGLHDDPRWQRLLERGGYGERQLARIEFEITLPDEEQ
jgi:TolB-like protein/Flp pilus assembly protein TadD